MPVEEPLSAASLAKRDGALLGSVAKRRHVMHEDEPMLDPQDIGAEAEVEVEEEQDVEAGAEQQPPVVPSVGEASVPAPDVITRADLAHIERLIMDTRVEIAALLGQVEEVAA